MHRLIGEAMVDLVVEVERTHLNPDQYMMMNITQEGVEVMVMTIRATVGSIFHRGTNQKFLGSIKHFDDDDEDGLAHGTGLDKTISDYLVSQVIISLCILPSYALTIIPLVTFCIHGDRKLVGRGLLYVLSRKFLLLDAFGALYNTFIHRVAWLCAWLYTDLHSNTVLPS
jgi:hypothetical protein